jgi:hypothetical protein
VCSSDLKGQRPHIAKDDQVARALDRATQFFGQPVNVNFLVSQSTHVVDAWQVKDAAKYLDVPRLGARSARLFREARGCTVHSPQFDSSRRDDHWPPIYKLSRTGCPASFAAWRRALSTRPTCCAARAADLTLRETRKKSASPRSSLLDARGSLYVWGSPSAIS